MLSTAKAPVTIRLLSRGAPFIEETPEIVEMCGSVSFQTGICL
jgi:hypothetical protein